MSANAGPAIQFACVSHRYGAYQALSDVSFDVNPGEIFGFIGPNGAGKTTTIQIIATLLEPTMGRVLVCGHDVALEPSAVRRRVGYMPDHAGTYERITVREYLEFFADAYGVGAVSDYASVDRAASLTDLGKLGDKLVSEMSKGMKQRLQLARVLLHDPDVLVLDEPASDLDPRARIEIRDLLVELRSMGKTVFLSSHILTELADLCTSVAILERGRIVVAGPIGEIGARLDHVMQGGVAEEGSPAAYRTPTSAGAPRRAAAFPCVRVRTLAPVTAIEAALAGCSAVRGVTPWQANAVRIAYAGDDAALAAIVRALVLANVPVCGVEPERSELERVFLEATRGEIQ